MLVVKALMVDFVKQDYFLVIMITIWCSAEKKNIKQDILRNLQQRINYE